MIRNKIIGVLITACVMTISSIASAAPAVSIAGETATIRVIGKKQIQDQRPVSVKEFFTQFCNTVGYGVPDVYVQIPLKITGVLRSDPLYTALQKCVYLGFIPNSAVKYQWTSAITPRFIDIFVSKNIKLDAQLDEEKNTITRVEFVTLLDSLPNYKMLMNIASQSHRGLNGNYLSSVIGAQGFDTLTAIYNTFKTDFRSGDKVGDDVLMQGAIKGMANSVGDIHTEYFPPAEAEEFNNQLQGTFEGIGGYLDMTSPGNIFITSVIKDAPAQKAGLIANDRIVKVDDYVITSGDTINTVIARIKGPSGTSVKLTIERGGIIYIFTVVRQKITISLLDYELKGGTPVITVHSFGWGVANSWVNTLKDHQQQIQNAGKLIIDLRDNPGGSLQEVAEMLSDFVPKDQPTVVTRSRYDEQNIVSAGRTTINFSQKKIVILVNASTASASEIMAGTIKDYFPNNTTIIGETTYGKGSVQYLQSFPDSSSFKMTIAHRYTGKTKKAIEGIGIKPDVEVYLDADQLKKGTDNQMQAALNQ